LALCLGGRLASLGFGFFDLLSAPTSSDLRQQDPAFIRRTFASIARRYDFANHALSMGIDFVWRARAAALVRGWAPAPCQR